MSELTLLLIRLAFLAVLWFFVIAAVGVIRTDLFGSRTAPAGPRKGVKPAKPLAKPKSKKRKAGLREVVRARSRPNWR